MAEDDSGEKRNFVQRMPHLARKGESCSLESFSLSLAQVDFANKPFWTCFFLSEWGNAYDGQEERSVADIIEESLPDPGIFYEWWREFTGYSEEVFEMSDGYLEDPTSLLAELDGKNTLKIEFHPGDTVYYINDTEIGCTGPHCIKRYPLSYQAVRKMLDIQHGESFFLLLPMVVLNPNNAEEMVSARSNIESLLRKVFVPEICGDIADCMVCALTEKNH